LEAAARRSWAAKRRSSPGPPSRGAPSARNGGSKNRERYLDGTFAILSESLSDKQYAINNNSEHSIIPFSSRLSPMPSNTASERTYISFSSSRAVGVYPSAKRSRAPTKPTISRSMAGVLGVSQVFEPRHCKSSQYALQLGSPSFFLPGANPDLKRVQAGEGDPAGRQRQ